LIASLVKNVIFVPTPATKAVVVHKASVAKEEKRFSYTSTAHKKMFLFFFNEREKTKICPKNGFQYLSTMGQNDGLLFLELRPLFSDPYKFGATK
jgi:hypothetical protein